MCIQHDTGPPQDLYGSRPNVVVLMSVFVQYFEAKFKCPTGNSTVHCRGFDRDFENFFSVAAMLPIIIMGVVNVWLQSK